MGATIPMERPSGFSVLTFHFLFSTFHFSVVPTPSPVLPLPTSLRYTQPMSILRRLSRWMGKQDHMTHLAAGNIAPGFSLNALDGKEYSLGALMERGPVVAAFFKISCPVCQFTFPFLERLYQRYSGDGVSFLGISQDDVKSTSSFANEYGVTFPILIDDADGYLVSNAYGLTSVPTIFLIETDGPKPSILGYVANAAASVRQAHDGLDAP